MPRLSLLLTVAVALCSPGALHADDAPNTLTEGERRAGWKLLFDGASTTGWEGYRQASFPEKGWAVDDGWLHVEAGGGGGDIVTADTYRSFELSLEWKAAPGANSGIIYRVGDQDGATYMSGPEFQVLDDADPTDDANTSAGALYGLYSPKGKSLKPAGEVNHARIVVTGDRVEHYLNGVLVVDAMLGSADWNERVANSKFADWPRFGKLDAGRIALQDHGNSVWFRNIKIRPIDRNEERRGSWDRIDLFDHRGLTGWVPFLAEEGADPEDTWRVEDGILICEGVPTGYIRTARDFTNYRLVIDWRWDPVTKKAGNSGVLLRQVGEDKVWPRCLEAQLMSGSAGDFYNIGDFPMQGDPERTSGRRTARMETETPVENPVGEWNHYDILVNEGVVELRINGQLVNRATEVWETPGKICLQSEGAEIHFRKVRLYPIEKAAPAPAGAKEAGGE